MFRKFSILLIVAFIGLFSSCKKKNQTVQDNIPYQTVNKTIYPNDPLFFRLQAVGGWVYLDNVGINGIIVYRLAMNSSADFIALERTSTYFPDDPYARVKVQSDNFTLKDTISSSKWQITNGSVLSGPATVSLRQYNAFYDNGTGALRITN